MFNITVYFEDTSRNQGIDNDVNIDVEVLGQGVYTPTNVEPLSNGLYNITVDASDNNFSTYGMFTIRVNASKTSYDNDTDTVDIVIIGNTTLTIVEPAVTPTYFPNEIFNVTVNFDDIIRTGIGNAMINYSINNGASYIWENVSYVGNGDYNITIYSGAFGSNYGTLKIIINATKDYYENKTEELELNQVI